MSNVAAGRSAKFRCPTHFLPPKARKLPGLLPSMDLYGASP